MNINRAGWTAVALFAGALAAPAAPECKPIRASARPETARALYLTQITAPLDMPVGDTIKIAGLTIPAQYGERNVLKIDARGKGNLMTYRNDQTISVTLEREGAKRPLPVRLFLKKHPDGSWTYRNVTQLGVQIAGEQFVIIDANANGLYNEPGVDGMAIRGHRYLFPLPGPDESWCSTKWEFTGLTFGPWGEEIQVSGRPLATANGAGLPVLQGIIEERLKLGLTPRPEDPKLSADLQKHCGYMSSNGTLTHPESKGKPGYSPEGHKAGLRSILSMGTPDEQVAFGMVTTYFHRIDVIRPDTYAFGVGYAGRYGGIDGRAGMRKGAPQTFWPVLCPAPEQTDVPLRYNRENPDATPGDNAAGYPITVQFHTSRLKLTGHKLYPIPSARAMAQAQRAALPEIDCYTYDPSTGASAGMTKYLRCVCLIPKDPLQSGQLYEVTMEVEVDGKPWTRTWRFTTGSGGEGWHGRESPRRRR